MSQKIPCGESSLVLWVDKVASSSYRSVHALRSFESQSLTANPISCSRRSPLSSLNPAHPSLTSQSSSPNSHLPNSHSSTHTFPPSYRPPVLVSPSIGATLSNALYSVPTRRLSRWAKRLVGWILRMMERMQGRAMVCILWISMPLGRHGLFRARQHRSSLFYT